MLSCNIISFMTEGWSSGLGREGVMSGSHFDTQAARDYQERPPRQVPGFADLHRMTVQLLGERMPEDGRLLVLGAGGGLELKAFALAKPGWTFEGVDPSPDMLALARNVVGEKVERMRFHQGTIEAAPEGPYDGATALLTFHFIARAERLQTLRQLRRRLRPGAPLIVAHISFSQAEPERALWVDRHIAYGNLGQIDLAHSEKSRAAIAAHLSILAPEEEEAMLVEAGFDGVSLFYAGLSFRGWVAYAY